MIATTTAGYYREFIPENPAKHISSHVHSTTTIIHLNNYRNDTFNHVKVVLLVS